MRSRKRAVDRQAYQALPQPGQKPLLVSLFVSSALLAAQQGLAQQSRAQTGAEPLEDVVIEARRFRPVEQTTATGLSLELVDTPQAISVLTEETFRVMGADTLYEALALIPGATQSGSGWGRDGIVLRGARFGSPRVNGVMFPLQTTLEQDAFERVEVVRGPATGLYGLSGSFSGEINQILKRPQEELHGSLEIKGGSYDYMRYGGDVTGAIPGTDGKLKARLVGVRQDWGRPQKVVDIENHKWMVMGALSYAFTESMEANLYYYDSRSTIDPYDGGAMVFRNGALETPPVPWENYYFSDPRTSVAKIDYEFFIADISHRLENDWVVKSQVSRQRSAFDGSYYYPFGPSGAYGLGENEVNLYTFDASRHFDRLTANVTLGGGFELFGREQQFFAALEYYGDGDPHYEEVLRSQGLGFINIFEGGQGVLGNGDPIPVVDRSTLPISTANETTDRTYRASLQLLLNATERLHFIGGLNFEKGTTDRHIVVGSGSDLEDDYNEVFGRIAGWYDLIEERGFISDANVYASYSQTSVPNTGVLDPDGNFISDSQVMTQYEIGLKAEMFGGALGGTLAIHDAEITNIPVSAHFLGNLFSGSIPGGERSVRGIELELLGELRRGWNVVFNYAYTDTDLTDPNFGSTDIQAKMISRNQGTLFTSYEWTTGSLAGLRVGGGVSVKSSYRLTDNPRTIDLFGNYTHPGYTSADFSVSYRRGGLELFATVDNAFDKDYFLTWEAHPGFGIQRGEPRTYRGGLRYSFD